MDIRTLACQITNLYFMSAWRVHRPQRILLMLRFDGSFCPPFCLFSLFLWFTIRPQRYGSDSQPRCGVTGVRTLITWALRLLYRIWMFPFMLLPLSSDVYTSPDLSDGSEYQEQRSFHLEWCKSNLSFFDSVLLADLFKMTALTWVFLGSLPPACGIS